MNDSLNFRKDIRSLEQFAEDIKCRTEKERFLIELFVQELIKLGRKVKLENYGIDNTGKVVKYSSCKPDYKLTIDDKVYLCEVKNGPVSHKWTFKTYQLEQYIKYKAYIVLFWGTGFIDKDPTKIDIENTRWGIIFPDKIQQMLDYYEPFNFKPFGNKPCIKIPKEHFELYVDKIRKLT